MEITHAQSYRGPVLDQLPDPSRPGKEPPTIEAKPGWFQGGPALVVEHGNGSGPHSVIHTPSGVIRCTRPEAESFERAMTGWTPTRREKALIQYASSGAYDTAAQAEDYDSGLCYILAQIDAAQGQRSEKNTRGSYWEKLDANRVRGQA